MTNHLDTRFIMNDFLPSEYNYNQLVTITSISKYLNTLSPELKQSIQAKIEPYLAFRKLTADFHHENFSTICTEKCFIEKTSACCGKEGIIVFFSDIFINLIGDSTLDLDQISPNLQKDTNEKCVYLTEKGCFWPIKPIICEMFLCDTAKDKVLNKGGKTESDWNHLLEMEKAYTKPDKPVLFDYLEKIFLEAGYKSPLAYFHQSPGLLRVKLKNGLITKEQYFELSGREKKDKGRANKSV